MPGLLVSGTTRRSAERKLRDAIALYLEEMRSRAIPRPCGIRWMLRCN
jgi:predicted RNase H-like HicB family nuclease